MGARVIEAGALHRFTEELFAATGLREEDARLVADCLVEADLRGLASHGVSRAAIYLERLRAGLVTARPTMKVTEIAPAMARLDADNGLGFLGATAGMAEAVRRAKLCGIGLCFVHHSNHFGMAASYLRQAVDAGMAAFVFTNASRAMPIWGGREAFLGTSPFAFATPGTDSSPPMLLDMATSVVARGKIRQAAVQGKPIPEGWALDPQGRPTTDAQAGYDGLILPLGGPKGSGLSLMMEVMGGVLSGSAFGGEVGNQYFDKDRPQNVGHCFIAVSPVLALETAEAYRERYNQLVARARACPRVDEDKPILMPGEPEAMTEAKRRVSGIPLDKTDIAFLRQEAVTAGLTLPDFLREGAP
ncbi:Ldh family oxidoreductase [Paracoccus sp. (in: a-proteobacteria)]|uniref:Ldh family oxidoreductase n=1 Tax=Paracoccus sp. TaxID=267 RepID=UPI002AFE3BA6|nr:Ldh family oxidoreductase [Paracoccus sp. (in: a-proteobacteria)]